MKKIGIITVFLFTWLLFEIPSNAQSSDNSGKLIRVEIETKQDSEPFFVIPFGSNGVLVFYESVVNTDDRDHRIWIFKLYDVNLNQTWIQEIPVIKDLEYRGFDISENILYVLFYNDDKGGTENNFQIVKISGQEDLLKAKVGRVPGKSSVSHFRVFESRAVMVVHTRSNNAMIFRFDMETAETSHITLNEDGLSFMLDIGLDTANQRINSIFKSYEEKVGEFIFARIYNYNWDIIKTIELNNDESRYLINDGEYIPINENQSLIIGTYKDNQRGKYEMETEELEMESTGFYIAEIKNDSNTFIKYYNFSEFSSFYKNLSVSDLSRIRKREKKSEQIAIDYKLLIHNVVPVSENYIFVAEAYYPEYHTVTRMMYDWYGRPMPSYYNVFDGYRYTSAFIACFDTEGNLKWDNGLDLWELLTNRLENRVNVIFDGEETVLAFCKDAEINYKVIEGNEDITGLDYVPVESKYSRDKLISESGNNMVYWYKNYFMIYGYQRIKNNALADQSKRNIFYINKMAFN